MNIKYKISPKIRDESLNELYSSAWPNHVYQSFDEELSHPLFYVCAFSEDRLVGFVKVIGDGTIHGFVLEPTVHSDFQRKGIGSRLLFHLKSHSKEIGLKWLHVDFEPHLLNFYRSNGFEHTEAGLIDISSTDL